MGKRINLETRKVIVKTKRNFLISFIAAVLRWCARFIFLAIGIIVALIFWVLYLIF